MMVGLYDRQGYLRFAGGSLDACLEYAALFDIPLNSGSLQDLPDPVVPSVRIRGSRLLEGRSS